MGNLYATLMAFVAECFLRKIERIEIAAGVIPGMREAWAKLSGRTRASFSTTSRERPLISLKLNVSGIRVPMLFFFRPS